MNWQAVIEYLREDQKRIEKEFKQEAEHRVFERAAMWTVHTQLGIIANALQMGINKKGAADADPSRK